MNKAHNHNVRRSRMKTHFLSLFSLRGLRIIAATGATALLSACFTTNAGPPTHYSGGPVQRADYQTDNTPLYLLGAAAVGLGAYHLYDRNRSRGTVSRGHHHHGHRHHHPRRSRTSVSASYSSGYYSPGYYAPSYGYPSYPGYGYYGY